MGIELNPRPHDYESWPNQLSYLATWESIVFQLKHVNRILKKPLSGLFSTNSNLCKEVESSASQ